MARVLKPMKLYNPGRRRASSTGHKRRNAGRRRMSAKQIKYFGTARQRAGLKAARSRHRHGIGNLRRAKKGFRAKARRMRNVSSIVTVMPNVAEGFRDASGIFHPIRASADYDPTRIGGKRRRKRAKAKGKGRKRGTRTVARARRRRSTTSHRRRASNPGVRRRRRAVRRHSAAVPNPHRRRRSVSHRRRRNSGYMVRHRRRRNPGLLPSGGTLNKVVGIVSGATLTKIISDNLPFGLNMGFMGYIGTGIVAWLQGQAVGKMLRSPGLAQDMTIGGYTYLALKIVNDFLPGIASGLGLRGLATSSFWVPQVPRNGSLVGFQSPPMLSAAMAASAPATMRGLAGMRSVRARRLM